MYNPDTEVLFPSRVIPTLAPLHGPDWSALIERLQSDQASPEERYGFVLMMVRLCGCAGCNADSFRAMRGCTSCARQAAKRLRGSDTEILQQYRAMIQEVETHLRKGD